MTYSIETEVETTGEAEAPETRPDWLPHQEWPFPISSLRSGDHTLAVTDTGGTGPTLLFVHVAMWSILWRDLMVELAGSGYRCVTLDAPGSGLTDGPASISIAAAADAVDTVVEQLALDDITLVIHDLGGPAALEASSRWPSRIRGIVAVNSFAWRPSRLSFRPMLALMGSGVMREIDTWTGWLPRLGSTRFGVGRKWSKATRKVFRQAMRHRGRRTFHRYVASVRKHDFTTIESTVTKLSELPLLTVFGQRNDPLRFQPKWADRFDDITQIVVPKALHFPMCDDPSLVAGAIDDWYRARV